MIDINDFFLKKYHPANYNCLHFSIDIWERLTGKNIKELFSQSCFSDIRKVGHSMLANFKETTRSDNLCLVSMQKSGYAPHIGVKWGGNIVHFGQSGMKNIDLECVIGAYDRVRYFLPCK